MPWIPNREEYKRDEAVIKWVDEERRPAYPYELLQEERAERAENQEIRPSHAEDDDALGDDAGDVDLTAGRARPISGKRQGQCVGSEKPRAQKIQE